MFESKVREIIKKISLVIAAIGFCGFWGSFLFWGNPPFGARSESILMAITSMLIYIEIGVLNVKSKTYKITILLCLLASLGLRFIGEAQLVVTPLITWGHIVFCILCLIWIHKESKQNNI